MPSVWGRPKILGLLPRLVPTFGVQAARRLHFSNYRYMSATTFRGTISFVHYDKHFATIDYNNNGKAKTVNFKTRSAVEGQKAHYFRVGDEVTFELKLSDRGDRMTAHNVKFLFNPLLEKLVQKAKHENRFSGYLKKVDDTLFIKEVESYLFFPLQLSPWETHPSEASFNAPYSFRLVNFDKQKTVAAELAFPVYKPEYRQAEAAMEAKKPVTAVVTKVSPYAVYLHLFGGALQSKLPLPAEGLEGLEPGNQLEVRITYMSPQKIVVAKA
jgi:hypothetical protein